MNSEQWPQKITSCKTGIIILSNILLESHNSTQYEQLTSHFYVCDETKTIFADILQQIVDPRSRFQTYDP